MSQGYGIAFTVQPGAPPYIDSWGVSFLLSCKETSRQTGVGHGFGGFVVPIVDDKFSFEYLDVFFYFKWSGRFTSPTHAAGNAVARWAVMIDDREIEKCDKRVTWEADLTTDAAKALAGRISKFVQVTKGQDGRITTELR